MKSVEINKQLITVFRYLLYYIFFIFISNSAFAQFRITAMQGEGGNDWVILKTLQEPGFQKQTNVRVNYNPNKTYKSGTIFQTSQNSKIQLQYRGQTVVLEPNTPVQTMVYEKGASVQSFGGKLTAILKDVKAKLGFFKVGNGYVWAHAEGTVFTVSSIPNSKKVTFATQDNSIINVLDKVNVNVQGNMGRAMTVSKKVGSNSYYASGNLPTRSFRTANDYINELKNRISQKLNSNNYYQLEELGDDYSILGFMYEQSGNLNEAYKYYSEARNIYYQWEPNGVDYKYETLSIAGLLIKNNQVVEGQNIVRGLLPSLLDDLNYYYDACHYWDVLDNLDTAYHLLGDYDKSDYYSVEADKLPCYD